MNRVLAILTLFLALSVPSFGQLIPGPPVDEKPGFPDPPCAPDLVVSAISNVPATVPAGGVLTFSVTVSNLTECEASRSNLLVQIEYLPFSFHYVNVSVPPFTPITTSHTVTVNYQVPSYLPSGFTLWISQLTVDSNNQVNETDELNNITLGPPTPIMIQ